MTRLADGDVQALGDLYLRYGDDISRVLVRLLPQAVVTEVDDLCQEVFLTVRDLAPRYQEQGKLRAWLIGIALRKARNVQRRQWVRDRVLKEQSREPQQRPLSAQDADSIAQRMDVQRAFAQLKPDHREVLILSVLEGLTAEEMTDILGVKPSAIWSRLHRARRAMVEVMGQLESGKRKAKVIP